MNELAIGNVTFRVEGKGERLRVTIAEQQSEALWSAKEAVMALIFLVDWLDAQMPHGGVQDLLRTTADWLDTQPPRAARR